MARASAHEGHAPAESSDPSSINVRLPKRSSQYGLAVLVFLAGTGGGTAGLPILRQLVGAPPPVDEKALSQIDTHIAAIEAELKSHHEEHASISAAVASQASVLQRQGEALDELARDAKGRTANQIRICQTLTRVSRKLLGPDEDSPCKDP